MIEEEKKPTKIIVLSDDSEYGQTAVQHGIVLGQIFQSEMEVIKPPLRFSDKTYYRIAEETNTILFVIGVQDKHYSKSGDQLTPLFNKKRAIKFIRKSRIPVLVVGNKTPEPDSYRNVMLPIDVDRQAKEKAMWASYFIRFFSKLGVSGTIHVIYNQHKEPVVAQKVLNNIEFIEKLYRNLELKYEIHPMTDVYNMEQKSIEMASQYDASVSIIMMTKFYSIIDILFGPKEAQIIGQTGDFSLLCLNERDDLYVLCQ